MSLDLPRLPLRLLSLDFLRFAHFRAPVGFCLDQRRKNWDRMIRVRSVRKEGGASDIAGEATLRHRTYLRRLYRSSAISSICDSQLWTN